MVSLWWRQETARREHTEAYGGRHRNPSGIAMETARLALDLGQYHITECTRILLPSVL